MITASAFFKVISADRREFNYIYHYALTFCYVHTVAHLSTQLAAPFSLISIPMHAKENKNKTKQEVNIQILK
jgi:hypothetical protein